MTDEGSFDSRMLYGDSFYSDKGTVSRSQYTRATEAKQVAKLADPREEANVKWKKMKALRDERNASLERRRAREAVMYNFTRVVHSTEQAEFHRAYRDQYMHQEYMTQRKHQDRKDERLKLDERMQKQLATRTKQQQQEGKFMRRMLRESANKARAALWEEVSLTKMNNELSGTVSRSQSCLDVSSSSRVAIPDQLRNRMKTAKRCAGYPCCILFYHNSCYFARSSQYIFTARRYSLVAFEAARKEVKDYYEASMSERIAQYSRTRNGAIERAGTTGTAFLSAFIHVVACTKCCNPGWIRYPVDAVPHTWGRPVPRLDRFCGPGGL
jgi:hypothetical protein